MSVIRRRDVYEREQRERRELIRELTSRGSWPALACMSDDQAEEIERLREQFAGAVAEATMLRRIVASTHDYLLLAPDDSVYYEGLLARVRDALGYDK